MKIIFMGTPDFAAMSLKRLYDEGRDIIAVFTQPDRARDRGLKISISPVKELALSHGTPVFQPETLRNDNIYAEIKDLNADIILVVAYGKLLPKEILDLPPFGCVNIHASLLPKYRGAAPIQWTIINGEKETGVTAISMCEEMDAGNILLTKTTKVGDNETSGELFVRLGILGAQLLSETLGAIEKGEISPIAQDPNDATYAPMLKKADAVIDWNSPAKEIKCKVRGLNPNPGAKAELSGKQYKIHAVEVEAKREDRKPGDVTVVNGTRIEVACFDGTIVINEIQAPGSNKMKVHDFLRGNSIFET